jgi:cell division septal protein FtsQ
LRSHLGIGWEVEMQGNIKIMLPEEKSLIIFKKFINNIYKIKRKHDIYVDLRYLNGFAVKNI